MARPTASWLVATLIVLLAALSTAAPLNPTPLWQYNFASPQAAVNPVVANGLVYVPTNTTLHVFNLTTGATVWTFDYSFGDRGGYAAVDEKHVT